MGPIVLASTSRWRLQLLAEAGIVAEAADPQVEESLLVGKNPIDTAKIRAMAKAEAVHQQFPDSLVIGVCQ
jgi:septum formation protein